jgi:DNA-directed RNA polymerase subunit RPC12/RpoP
MQTRVPLDDNDQRRLVLKLVTHLRCVRCGQSYNPHDFALVERQETVWHLGIQCRHCHSEAHILVVMQPAAAPEPPIDLTPEEVQAANAWPPVSGDDVLDVHEWLQRFDGDFQSHFAP